jgi:hypothetical protein
VTEICHMALLAHTLRGVKFRLEMFSKEGHFTPEVEAVFRPYFHSHRSGPIEICHVSIPEHGLRAVQVTLKSARNERHFTCQAETLFVRISPRIGAG